MRCDCRNLGRERVVENRASSGRGGGGGSPIGLARMSRLQFGQVPLDTDTAAVLHLRTDSTFIEHGQTVSDSSFKLGNPARCCTPFKKTQPEAIPRSAPQYANVYRLARGAARRKQGLVSECMRVAFKAITDARPRSLSGTARTSCPTEEEAHCTGRMHHECSGARNFGLVRQIYTEAQLSPP